MLELFGWPVPELIDSSREREPRVRRRDLGHELVARDGIVILPGPLGVDARAPVSHVSAQTWAWPMPVGMVQAAEDRELVAQLLQGAATTATVS